MTLPKMIVFGFHKVCDADYCHSAGNMTDKRKQDILKTLCDLNEESYDKRYKEDPASVKMSEFIEFSESGPRINTFQFLKYAECLQYNIEVDTINRELSEIEKDALKCLDRMITEIQCSVIGNMDQYKAAKWCEAV